MFSAASKTYFTAAGAAIVLGLLYAVFAGDRAGFTLLVFAGIAALVMGLAAFWTAVRDPAAVVAVSGELEEPTVVDATDVPRPSPWPPATAAALGVFGLGAAFGKSLVVLGAVIAFVIGFAWFGQVWREHPSWTQAMTDRLNDRVVIPFGLPVTIFVLLAVAVISFSRILLTASEQGSRVVALIAAVAILAAGFALAGAQRLGTGALGALAAVAGILVVTAGVLGAARGERAFHGEHGAGELRLAAKNISFDLDELDLPAASAVKLKFDNNDTGVPHNVSILSKESGESFLTGKVIDGGTSIVYEFKTPEAGEYEFQCDVHPAQMKGKVIVSEEASQPSEPGPNAPTTTSEH